MARYFAFLKKHWEWATAIGVTLVGILIYYVRSRSSSSSAAAPTSTVSAPAPPMGSGSSSGGSVATDLTGILQQLQTQQQAAQAAMDAQAKAAQAAADAQAQVSQTWWQQALQSLQDSFTSQNAQAQAQAQASQSSLASILAQDQAALAQQVAQVGSINVATGGIGPVAATTPSSISALATGLNVPLSWIQGYIDQGGKTSDSLAQIDAYLKSPDSVPNKIKAAGSQGGAYVPGSAPATSSAPAGGGTWNGQNDQQIQQLFQNTYGSNWQTVWNQQHAAAVAKNGG